MPKHEFKFTAIVQALGNDNYLGEALLFPEVSRLRKNAEAPRDDLRANLARLIEEDLAPLELHRRRFDGQAEIGQVEIMLDPPARSIAWRTPVAALKNHGFIRPQLSYPSRKSRWELH